VVGADCVPAAPAVPLGDTYFTVAVAACAVVPDRGRRFPSLTSPCHDRVYSPGARTRAAIRAASATSASSAGASRVLLVDSTVSRMGVFRVVQATPMSLAVP